MAPEEDGAAKTICFSHGARSAEDEDDDDDDEAVKFAIEIESPSSE